MNIKILILFFMMFCHVVDDYYLQGILASMKQRRWWRQNAPEPKYRYDYIVALFMHSFSWSFMIMLPIIVYDLLNDATVWSWFPVLLVVNLGIHMLIDNLKANRKAINLLEDQLIHVIQICSTWILWMQYLIY